MTHEPPGPWRLRGWAGARVAAGGTDRSTDRAALLRGLPASVATVEAEQVHGSSIAVVERAGVGGPIAGCDALLTREAGLALLIRTADCLPILFADPVRGVVGIAHAGWRGLASGLPARVVSLFRHTYHTPPRELRVAIGPAIRACCYEVGPEFAGRFGSAVRLEAGRRTCDLVGVATEQLIRCGVAPSHLVDVRWCTACATDRWFSLRREGPATGRLLSFVMVRP